MLAALPRTLGAAPFKQGMRALAFGVTVIAAQDREGLYLGLTATAVTSLSAEPPSLLVCVNRSSALAEALQKGVLFSVNVLAQDQADIAQAFGGQRPVRGMGRFAYGNWFRSGLDVPLLTGARVNFECTVAEATDWATHRMVIGGVCDVHLTRTADRPLIYHDGRYTSLEDGP
jgi:flavin reductase (DIM6/NTAB) family NADH-FMN oxidoreductase RutF